MAFYSPVGVERQYRVGRSREDMRACFCCKTVIPKNNLRVYYKRNPYQCYCSKECFEKEFKHQYTVDFDSGIISRTMREEA